MYQQLPLAVQLNDQATFDNFYIGENALLVDQLRQQLIGGERYIYLYGSEGSGRSHLLQAACHNADRMGRSSVYLPLAELINYSPADLLEGLELCDLLCLDNVELAIGRQNWEQALFHLYNRLHTAGAALLVSADRSARELPIGLADLSSRLCAGAVFRLQSLSEEDCCRALQLRAQQRGLQLSEDLVQFIYLRHSRDLSSLMDTLEKLDQASLQDRRKLTIPFVKHTLGW